MTPYFEYVTEADEPCGHQTGWRRQYAGERGPPCRTDVADAHSAGARAPYTASAVAYDAEDDSNEEAAAAAVDTEDVAEGDETVAAAVEEKEEEESVLGKGMAILGRHPASVAPEEWGGEGLTPFLAPRVTDEIFALYQSDPSEWSVGKISRRFGMTQARVMGILKLHQMRDAENEAAAAAAAASVTDASADPATSTSLTRSETRSIWP